MVATQFVGGSEGLSEGVVGGGCRVYLYGGGARGGEDLCGRYREGVYVGDMSFRCISEGCSEVVEGEVYHCQ